MDHIDRVTLAATLLLSAASFALFNTSADRFLAIVVVLSLTAAVVAANHSIPRPPRLQVDYREVSTGRPVVWQRDGASADPTVQVSVRNVGRGTAESIEVRFNKLGATNVWNESGNFNKDVDDSVHPPRFTSGTRVLNPGEEWVIARLSWLYDAQPTTKGDWTASARGMRSVNGEVSLDLLDQPPVQT
jgi:hypothetical protein